MQKLKKMLMIAICLVAYGQILGQKQQPVLNHIAVYVKDLAASTHFYMDIVQLDTIPEPFHDGRHTWFNAGGSHLHLIQGAAAIKTHDKNNHICFSVASIDTFIKRLQHQHIDYENWAGVKNAVTQRADGVQQIYFKDPDGYWLEINDAR